MVIAYRMVLWCEGAVSAERGVEGDGSFAELEVRVYEQKQGRAL